MGVDLARALDVARSAVQAGAAAAMRFFPGPGGGGHALGLEFKRDESPVTAADRASEAAMLAVIRAAFPEHAILTEESGEHAALVSPGRGFPHTRWIVDPLDGTGRFARGMRHWGPLVALEHEGEVVVGAAGVPAVGAAGEAWWAARGMGCWRDGERVRMSAEREWRRSNLSLGSASRILDRPGVRELATTCAYCAAGNDLVGGLMVLCGHAEAWIEGGVRVWDVAPFKVMAQEAGGSFRDLSGGASIENGEAVVCAPGVEEHVRRALGIR